MAGKDKPEPEGGGGPTCRWIWNGVAWAEDPKFPHNCPQNTKCKPPASPGTYIGEEAETPCM